MILSTLLSTLPLLISASPAPSLRNHLSPRVSVICSNGTASTLNFLEISSALHKRGDTGCNSPTTTFATSDAIALQTGLQYYDPNHMHELLGLHETSWDHGSVRECVNNWYVWENTYVSEWEIGCGIAYILDMCCKGPGQW